MTELYHALKEQLISFLLMVFQNVNKEDLRLTLMLTPNQDNIKIVLLVNILLNIDSEMLNKMNSGAH
jgi:hypothetical protein